MEGDYIDDGGPAFPQGEHGDHIGGMTLRDYFAGKALSAGISNEAKEWELTAWFGKNASCIKGEQIVAARAYAIADAMLARRK